jgi:hypothetical protein
VIRLSHVHTTADVPAAGPAAGARPGVIDSRGGSTGGRILDGEGRSVAGASVHVEEIDTAAARTGRSDASGRYEVIGLPAGPVLDALSWQRVYADHDDFAARPIFVPFVACLRTFVIFVPFVACLRDLRALRGLPS